MRESEFADLLGRFEKGLCTPEEEALLRKWFDAGTASAFANETEKEQILTALRSSIYQKANLKADPNPGLWTTSFLFKIAASLLAVAIIGYLVYSTYYSNNAATLLTATTTDSIKKLHLPDGTLIWLKPQSRLTYPPAFTGQQRRVTLQGEALFEVQKDARHPFIISCNDLTTTVLGTSFNIRSEKNAVEVIVLTGRVFLNPGSHNDSLIITHEEKGLYQKNLSKLSKTNALEEDTRKVTQGTEYNMYFEDTRMEDLINRIERKFDVTIKTDNPRLNNCLITADLTDLSLEKTLDIISSITPIKYQLANNTITLTGNGCN